MVFIHRGNMSSVACIDRSITILCKNVEICSLNTMSPRWVFVMKYFLKQIYNNVNQVSYFNPH